MACLLSPLLALLALLVMLVRNGWVAASLKFYTLSVNALSFRQHQ